MVEENTKPRIAFIGNTKLTLKCMKVINEDATIVSVFGLSDVNSKDKTAYVNLDNYCNTNNIQLFKSEDWQEFGSHCNIEEIDIVIAMGDSRIIPPHIINHNYVIGNHGAILPSVQGGASLVWGRLLNTGTWGISIMEIDKVVDSGKILTKKEFSYDETCTEEEFVEICDDLTVEALIDVFKGDYSPINNKKYDVRISKHTDSEIAIRIMQQCLQNNLCVYMPPRTFDDSIVKEEWCEDFKRVFKIAQNKPYPKYIQPKFRKALS